MLALLFLLISLNIVNCSETKVTFPSPSDFVYEYTYGSPWSETMLTCSDEYLISQPCDKFNSCHENECESYCSQEETCEYLFFDLYGDCNLYTSCQNTGSGPTDGVTKNRIYSEGGFTNMKTSVDLDYISTDGIEFDYHVMYPDVDSTPGCVYWALSDWETKMEMDEVIVGTQSGKVLRNDPLCTGNAQQDVETHHIFLHCTLEVNHDYAFWIVTDYNCDGTGEYMVSPEEGVYLVVEEDKDCDGMWTDCDVNCEKTYKLISWSTGNGMCYYADGETTECSPGEGACEGAVIEAKGYKLMWQNSYCEREQHGGANRRFLEAQQEDQYYYGPVFHPVNPYDPEGANQAEEPEETEEPEVNEEYWHPAYVPPGFGNDPYYFDPYNPYPTINGQPVGVFEDIIQLPRTVDINECAGYVSQYPLCSALFYAGGFQGWCACVQRGYQCDKEEAEGIFMGTNIYIVTNEPVQLGANNPTASGHSSETAIIISFWYLWAIVLFGLLYCIILFCQPVRKVADLDEILAYNEPYRNMVDIQLDETIHNGHELI